MAKEEIVFRMQPDGSREVEVNGVTGKNCAKMTEKMLKDLGKKTDEKKKSDYNKVAVATKDTQTQW